MRKRSYTPWTIFRSTLLGSKRGEAMFRIVALLSVGLLTTAGAAPAQAQYYSGGYSSGYGGHYHYSPGHYHYHPGSLVPHYDHFDYVPGHYHYHAPRIHYHSTPYYGGGYSGGYYRGGYGHGGHYHGGYGGSGIGIRIGGFGLRIR